jgi:ribosomal protein L11 methyltransferase
MACYFEVRPLHPAVEILVAQLAEVGFESFLETDEGLTAYIKKEDWQESLLTDIQVLKSEDFNISFTCEAIEQTNWNAEWEKNFDPIVVDNMCTVRAPFHTSFDTPYDIVIEPKMSFGTGHHETTHLMIQQLLNTDLNGRSVLDMGCGTGVLAILAEMKGARTIDAIDIDNWSYLNTLENVERNKCRHISVFEGDTELIIDKKYDVVIANINRNVLLNDMHAYATSLNANGMVFLSGFYLEDLPVIERECNRHMLKLQEKLEKNNWVSLKFLN